MKLAATLRKIISNNKNVAREKKHRYIQDVKLIDGVRQLEASSRLSYTIVQGVLSGKRDVQFTSLISLIEDGLELRLSEFAKLYDSISEEEVINARKEIAESKKTIKKKSIKK